jgi:BirA family biotin operon repressor/biotin-[acetyl-CoA-carboxylase] ligase
MIEEELSTASISHDLATSFVGRRAVCYKSLASTMETARQAVLEGAAEGTAIVTEEQTAGRGRLRREWLTPRGCVAVSVILYPELKHLPSLVMVASLAVTNAINVVTGLEPQIKWPNDVLIDGKKVCGILVESGVQAKDTHYAVIGIGINVNLDIGCLGNVAAPATSLSEETGGYVSRLEVVRQLLVEFERLYLLAKEGDAVYRQWRDSLVTLGKQVTARCGEQVYAGTAETVDRDGSLRLRRPDGSTISVAAGDVTLQQL